jgi:hypothetical protein
VQLSQTNNQALTNANTASTNAAALVTSTKQLYDDAIVETTTASTAHTVANAAYLAAKQLYDDKVAEVALAQADYDAKLGATTAA